MSLHLFNEVLITNIAAIVIGASLANTLNTSFKDGYFSLTPVLATIKIAPSNTKAVVSILTFSNKNETKPNKSRLNAKITSHSII